MYKKLDITGQKFGRLVVIGRSFKKYKNEQPHWECRCDCGTMRRVYQGSLTRGITVSCGCYRNERTGNVKRLRPFEGLYNILASNTRDGKVSCELTYEEFLEFTKITKCHYCGDDITWYEFNTAKNGSGYNIDRKDNAIGYNKGNCVVSCGICNWLKSKFNYEEFLQQVQKIARYQNERNCKN